MRYAIIGGGAAGCTLAWHLSKKGHDVCVFESGDGPGGLAASIPFGKTRLDRFYHHIFTSDTHIQAFIDKVGLSDKLKWLDSTVGFERQGKLYPFTTPVDLLRFKPLSLFSRFRVGLSVLKMRRRDSYSNLETITAEEYIIREMGEPAYRILWEPLLRSKFGDRYREVSAVWFWGKIKLRGGTRSKSGTGECLGYLQDGWAQIYEAMVETIEEKGGVMRYGTSVEEIIPLEGERYHVRVSGETNEFDRVIVTTSVPAFVKMVPSLPDDYCAHIGQIPYQSNITMIVGMDRSISPFYWLNITDPESPFVAVIEHTNLLPDPNYGEFLPVYLSRYLSTDHPFFQMETAQLKEMFLSYLEKIFPGFQQDWIGSFLCSKAECTQPVIGLRYSEKKPAFNTPFPGLYLCTMIQIYPEDRGQNYSIKMAESLLCQLGELDRLSA